MSEQDRNVACPQDGCDTTGTKAGIKRHSRRTHGVVLYDAPDGSLTVTKPE